MSVSPKQGVVISAPNMQIATVRLRGISPLVMHRFAAKSEMMAKMAEGAAAKLSRKRDARDYSSEMERCLHRDAKEGWIGIPASAFRNAMIDACRLTQFKMTQTKMLVFVVEDGFDQDGMPIVKLEADEPEESSLPVRNSTGVIDIRVRPMWRRWNVNLTLEYDEDFITLPQLSNLIFRAGRQVGILEGRPFSKDSNGMGWGRFALDA